MHLLDAAILGVIEGITEFLPISSTGHLILAGQILGIPNTEVYKVFEVVIQVGAILAVLLLYWRSLLDMAMLKRLFVAFLPTAVIGFTVYPLFKSYLSGNSEVVVWSLFIGGVVLLVSERLYPSARVEEVSMLSYRDCVLIGLCQAVAIIPGVSRAGATIVGGRILGIGQRAIVEFSFLLAIPTMCAASAYDLYKNRDALQASDAGVFAVGLLVSFVVAWVVIRWFLKYIRTHSFAVFGVYRIIAAGVFALVVII